MYDPVLCNLRRLQLFNNESDRVKVINLYMNIEEFNTVTLLHNVPYTARHSRGKTFAIGVENGPSRKMFAVAAFLIVNAYG